MTTPKWIVAIVLVMALSMPVKPVSAAPSASISLTIPIPNPGFVDEDIHFDLVIDVTDIDPGVAGAEIFLAYNPAVVTPPASPQAVAVALPDFFGVSNVTIAEVLLNDARCQGQSPCIHLVVAGPPQPQLPQTPRIGVAARFFFHGEAEGRADFTIVASKLVNADGFDVPHTVAVRTQSIQIVFAPTVKGIVKRQGIAGSSNPAGGTLACTEAASTYGSVFTDGDGNFSLRHLLPGTHTLHAEYPGYLGSEKTITITSPGPTTIDVGTTTLRGGDVNFDNRINILDIGKIISLFDTSGASMRSDSESGCSDADEPADINDDGNINISDLAIAAGNWGLTEPTNWP